MLPSDNPTPQAPTRPHRRWKHLAAAAGIGALSLTALVAGPALADHPEVSLSGSDFEIDTDANLKVDDAAPSIDWASVTQVRKGEQSRAHRTTRSARARRRTPQSRRSSTAASRPTRAIC